MFKTSMNQDKTIQYFCKKQRRLKSEFCDDSRRLQFSSKDSSEHKRHDELLINYCIKTLFVLHQKNKETT